MWTLLTSGAVMVRIVWCPLNKVVVLVTNHSTVITLIIDVGGEEKNRVLS